MQRLLRPFFLGSILTAVLCLPLAAEDLHLKDLIEEAVKNSPDIRMAEARASAAGQRISQEGSLPDPMFSAGYQNEGLKRYNYGDSPDAQWMFSLAQTFPFPGKRSLQKEAAAHEAGAQKDAAETVRREVIARVAQAYYDLLLAVKDLDIIEARKPLTARLEEAALARYASGSGSQEEVIMAQSEKYMLMENEAMAQSRRESAEAMIRREIGSADMSPLGRPADTAPTPFPYSLEELVKQAEMHAPVLAERREMVLSSEKKLTRAGREALPDITLMPQYSSRGDGFEDMWSLTATIPLPIYYRSRQGAAVAESSMNLEGARKELDAARLKVSAEIRDNLAMIHASERVMELYRTTLIPKARQKIDAALALFASGRSNASEALSTLKAPYDYELTLWQQQVQREKAIARIKALTGDMEGR